MADSGTRAESHRLSAHVACQGNRDILELVGGASGQTGSCEGPHCDDCCRQRSLSVE